MMLITKSVLKIENVAIHHTGGIGTDYFAKSQDLTAEMVDAAHYKRWPDFESSLGYYGGYTKFYDKNGKGTQFRAIGEETAAQVGHNFDTIALCLAGNFSIDPKTGNPVELPTDAQKKALLADILWLIENKLVKIPNILPHRLLTYTSTECNGSALPNDWAQKLVFDSIKEKLNWLQILVLQLQIKLLQMLSGLKVTGGLSGRYLDGHMRG